MRGLFSNVQVLSGLTQLVGIVLFAVIRFAFQRPRLEPEAAPEPAGRPNLRLVK